jgi:ribosome-binding ATPase YchF (GTP1/OBG family)
MSEFTEINDVWTFKGDMINVTNVLTTGSTGKIRDIKKMPAWRFDPSRTFTKRQAHIFWDIYIFVILVSKQFATFLHISLGK